MLETTLKPPAPTAALVEFKKNGLQLPENLSFEAWAEVGRKVQSNARSAPWILGDWLAHGQTHFGKSHWGNRIPDGLYDRVSKATGYAYQTLANAKHVCSKLPISKRRDGLTFGHALEIVARVPADEYGAWITRAVEGDGMTVKELREALRASKAEAAIEAEDKGVRSLLEVARQCVRDCSALAESSEPRTRAEAKKILLEAIRALS